MLSEIEKEIICKKELIIELLSETAGMNYWVDKFFDVESDKMLDEKIEVLTAVKEGKTISEIPKFYDVLELYPKDEETVEDNQNRSVTMWD